MEKDKKRLMGLLANKMNPAESDYDYLLTVAFEDVMEKEGLLMDDLKKENAELQENVVTMKNVAEDAISKYEALEKTKKLQDTKITNLKKTIFQQSAKTRKTNIMLREKDEEINDLKKTAELEKNMADMRTEVLENVEETPEQIKK